MSRIFSCAIDSSEDRCGVLLFKMDVSERENASSLMLCDQHTSRGTATSGACLSVTRHPVQGFCLSRARCTPSQRHPGPVTPRPGEGATRVRQRAVVGSSSSARRVPKSHLLVITLITSHADLFFLFFKTGFVRVSLSPVIKTTRRHVPSTTTAPGSTMCITKPRYTPRVRLGRSWCVGHACCNTE